MELLMEYPPLTPTQRVAVLRHVSDLGEQVATIKRLLRASDDADTSDVERTLAGREHELSRLRALLAH
jgi:hypothetical protein